MAAATALANAALRYLREREDLADHRLQLALADQIIELYQQRRCLFGRVFPATSPVH